MSAQPRLITSISELRAVLSAARGGEADRPGAHHGRVARGAFKPGAGKQVPVRLHGSLDLCESDPVWPAGGPGKISPRLQADLDALAALDADVVFAPGDDEMYPEGYCTWVEVGEVAEPLEGRCRPGHFRGVATVVLKLFDIVQPDAAYFGQKDFQQALVIRCMVRDLNLPVEIAVCPTVREADGLAMSSRNRYLSPPARQRALVLWQSLQLAAELVAQGERNAEKIIERMRKVILTAGDAKIDYVALVDVETLMPVDAVAGRTLAALAVKIENTRLIDNCVLEPP